jgi:hypothetical protein
MVIYEWADVNYLGKATGNQDDDMYPYVVSVHTFQLERRIKAFFQPKTYVCTSDAVRSGQCGASQLGRFILDLPSDRSLNTTSFYTARVGFGEPNDLPNSNIATANTSNNGFWNDPEGNPELPPEATEYASPWRREDHSHDINESPSGILWYKDPIQYHVMKTGYYCVGG